MTTRSLAVLAVLATACSHSRGTSESAPAPRPAPAAATARAAPPATHMPMCPLDVEGAQVAAADTPTGETVTFTTTVPAKADELRARVRAMAEMHNRHHAGAGGAPHDAHHADATAGARHDAHHAGMPPPSSAAVEDVENGARIVVTPSDPANLAQLQGAVREHAQRMQREGCGHMGAPAR